jgi:hypothetical protein
LVLTNEENILKQLIIGEEQCTLFRKIKSILAKFRQKVVAVEVPTNDGCWELKPKKRISRKVASMKI